MAKGRLRLGFAGACRMSILGNFRSPVGLGCPRPKRRLAWPSPCFLADAHGPAMLAGRPASCNRGVRSDPKLRHTQRSSASYFKIPDGPGRKSPIVGVLTAPSDRKNPMEKVGGVAPYLFQWVLR